MEKSLLQRECIDYLFQAIRYNQEINNKKK